MLFFISGTHNQFSLSCITTKFINSVCWLSWSKVDNQIRKLLQLSINIDFFRIFLVISLIFCCRAVSVINEIRNFILLLTRIVQCQVLWCGFFNSCHIFFCHCSWIYDFYLCSMHQVFQFFQFMVKVIRKLLF